MLIRVFVVFSFYAIRSGQQRFAVSGDFFSSEHEDEDWYISTIYNFSAALCFRCCYVEIYICNSDNRCWYRKRYVLQLF